VLQPVQNRCSSPSIVTWSCVCTRESKCVYVARAIVDYLTSRKEGRYQGRRLMPPLLLVAAVTAAVGLRLETQSSSSISHDVMPQDCLLPTFQRCDCYQLLLKAGATVLATGSQKGRAKPPLKHTSPPLVQNLRAELAHPMSHHHTAVSSSRGAGTLLVSLAPHTL
jgi:hypothetical protein